MTVFKTFLKILNKNKFIIILYTVILVAFAGINFKTNDNAITFTESKPDILIINNDVDEKITENLIKYLEYNTNTIDIKNSEEAINDALFYRKISYIIYIPENYSEDFINGENPTIEVKSTGDYNASYAEMLLERYTKTANTYSKIIKDEDELIEKINSTLENEAKIEITSELNTTALEEATFYYNFLNYSFLATSIYIICLILFCFREEKIRKRTIISSMNYKEHNRILLLSNAILSVVLWALYVLLSFVLIGDIMFTSHGLILIINSFVFSLCTLCMAFLIGNLINNKNSINGIVNVVALGSSFLAGAFVPAEFLPGWVLKVAHILPSYWYINTNDIVKTLEVINNDTLNPIYVNTLIIILFSVIFIIITNIISKKKRKLA